MYHVYDFLNKYNYTTAKVSQEVNRKDPARNTMAQLLSPHTDPDHPTMHFVADGRTDDIIMPIAKKTPQSLAFP